MILLWKNTFWPQLRVLNKNQINRFEIRTPYPCLNSNTRMEEGNF